MVGERERAKRAAFLILLILPIYKRILITIMKSRVAFLLSAQMLFEHSPKGMYLWLFTFEKVYNDWEYPFFWEQFAKRVKNLYPLACGLRVVEAHGGGHGLHYHLLINKRLSIQLVVRIAKRYGIGFTSVKKCWDFGAALYLAKYLAKDMKGGNTPLKGGIHRWGTFGPWTGVRKNSIEVKSNYMTARKEIVSDEKVVIGYEFLLRGSYTLHGRRGMALCMEYLRRGQTSSACLLVSPNIRLTKKGGIARVIPLIPFQSSRRN